MLLAAAFVLELARESLTGTHCRYRQYVNGLPTDHHETRPCPAQRELPALRAPEEGLRWSDGRVIRREIVYEAPLRPWQHDYDAETGQLVRRTPFYLHAKPARVFDPNPVAALNAPTLQDLNDAAAHIPPAAYQEVLLDDRAPHGPHVTLVDRQPRFVAPPAGSLLFDRADDGFEDVNAYFHIDRNQRYLRSLGYDGSRAIAPYAVEVDAHAAGGDDNSFFIPSTTQPGRGTLYYGEGGTDDAEDADIVVHEYAHALMEWISPGTFTGSFASEARALAEAVSDYWAFSAHLDTRLRSGRDPFCFADWDARCWLDAASERCAYPPGSDCLRRLDSARTMADYDRNESAGVEHLNSAIWSSALREIRMRMDRRAADRLVMESLFGAPPRPTFAAMAVRLLEADRVLHRGANAMLICSAMTARGILTGCDLSPRGERTHFQSRERGIDIPDVDDTGITSTLRVDDARIIENLYVRVDIAHPARGDLHIELVAPDRTTVVLQTPSTSVARDIHVTYGLTATPATPLHVLRGRRARGEWTLRVSDRTLRDAGTLLSWALEIQFAGDAPLATRPQGRPSQMIPVVGRLHGEPGLFVSDLRIANPRTTVPRTATLIFTPSGENGLERFAAVQVALAPGQTIAFDDIVESVFHTGGSGSLEVVGDVVVMSRTSLLAASGVMGQQVPPNLDTTAAGEPPLVVWRAAFSTTGRAWRANVGVTETAGGEGIVTVAGRPFTIRPFSHMQFPLDRQLALAEVTVSGTARVTAYLSQVDVVSGDPLFVAGERLSDAARAVIAPVRSQSGLDLGVYALGGDTARIDASLLFDGRETRTTLDAGSRFRVFYWLGVLSHFRENFTTPAALRLRLPPRSGAALVGLGSTTAHSIPFADPNGPPFQHLLFVERSGAPATTIGFVAEGPAVAEVTVYDAAGTELARQTLTTAGGAVELPRIPLVRHGRALVRFLVGNGRAYAVANDGAAGDVTYFPHQ